MVESHKVQLPLSNSELKHLDEFYTYYLFTYCDLTTIILTIYGGKVYSLTEGLRPSRKKEEGRRKKEEGRRKKEEGRRKKEEGRRKKEEVLKYS
ncbi:MAG: hypothetical protein QNJ47_20365 [Nostocaceae cyanobacterium]|nr:hypothetical protein [Nostocaceae cyanobacterium]